MLKRVITRDFVRDGKDVGLLMLRLRYLHARDAYDMSEALQLVGQNFHARARLLCPRARIFSALNKQAGSLSSASRLGSILGGGWNRPFEQQLSARLVRRIQEERCISPTIHYYPKIKPH
jgi:hypothetical protein